MLADDIVIWEESPEKMKEPGRDRKVYTEKQLKHYRQQST